MASIQYAELIDAIVSAIESSGQSATVVSDRREVPARILVSGPTQQSIVIWAYVKNLTPADRADPDEYRIQLSGRILPLALNPDGATILLGYHASLKLFVGFDAVAVSSGARTQVSGGYVSLRAVKRARHRGMSFDRDRLGRIAVGLRPEMLIPYCLHASEIHGAASEKDIVRILSRTTQASNTSDFDINIDQLPLERQRLLRQIRQIVRNAGFRKRVLDAYERRCAISGTQLGLVEAAHILPVSVHGSTDDVPNGLSLAPQFHRAFDCGLIFLTTEYVMKINPERATELKRRSLNIGLRELETSLGRIRLPRTSRLWPDPLLIKRANVARGIREV